MNFWHIQLHPDNASEFPREKVRKILEETQYIGMGEWEEGKVYIDQFTNVLKPGDIVLVRSKGPLALVEVIGEPEKTPTPNVDFDWFENRRKVKILQFFDEKVEEHIGKKVDGIFNTVTFASANTSEFIKKWFSLYSNSYMLDKAKALLQYKKQIILQGPPGTGKTYMAKKIAKELTAPKDLGIPLQKIDSFFESFNSKKQENLESRQEKEKLLQDFQKLFPKEGLKELSLKSYCIGTGVRDNFCWWIERGLKPLGYYFPGSSQSYLIYWSQKEQSYKTHYRSLKAFKDIEAAEEGMRIISDLIFSLVNQTEKVDLEELPFGWSFILKILHSYYPEKYFPANGQNYMSNILNLLGQENSTKSPLEKNLLLQAFFEKKKAEYGADVKNYEFMTWLDNEFDLKGDIDLTDQKLISKGESKLIQFHPAYTYEDFVRGIVVETNDGPHPEYKVVDKVLAEFASKALANKSSNYVLIIDEINRANLPSVLGELIYALEYRFDPKKPEETSVESMYSLRDEGELEGSEGRILRLPDNLFIIGTMNTADRSVGHIDYAIRRRFAFVNVPPSEQPIRDVIENKQTLEKALELFQKVSALFQKDYLNSDFKAEEVQLGHSYFLAEDEATLKLKLDFEIKPLLKEYVKDGILNEKAVAEIEKL